VVENGDAVALQLGEVDYATDVDRLGGVTDAGGDGKGVVIWSREIKILLYL
jgi:hypothetical protein